MTDTEAKRVQPESCDTSAQDAFTRLLARPLNPTGNAVAGSENANRFGERHSGSGRFDAREAVFGAERVCLPALVGKTKGSGQRHQPD